MIPISERKIKGLKLFTGFPLPKHHSLVCPHCNEYKMYAGKRFGTRMFQCSGPKCEKWTSIDSIESFIGQKMVEE